MRKALLVLGPALLLCGAARLAYAPFAVWPGAHDQPALLRLPVRVTPLRSMQGDRRDQQIEVTAEVKNDESAALIVADASGDLVMSPLPFDRVVEQPRLRRTVLSRSALRLFGHSLRASVLAGESHALKRLLAALAASSEPKLKEMELRAARLGLRHVSVQLGEGSPARDYSPHVLAALEHTLQTGDPERALNELEALLPAVPGSAAPRVHALLSEAALAFGRVALANRYALRGLALLGKGEPVMEARLLRAQLSAEAAGGLADHQSRARERLRELASLRSDPLEAALDAQSDLRFALVHDRAYADPLTETSARALVDAAQHVPEGRLGPLASMLCEAGARLTSDERASRLFVAAERAAEREQRVASQAYCAFARGDLAQEAKTLAEAEQHYLRALSVLGDRRLPREQREAWYSAALSAEERGDLHEAFVRARHAAEWVDVLLALETDLADREALLMNSGSYYAHAVALGTRAGESEAALVLSEASKGRAVRALLRGVGEIEESAVGAWIHAPLEPSAIDPHVLQKLSRGLGERDAAITYTVLRASNRDGIDLVIGLVTRNEITSILVETPDGFREDLAALPQAVARNETARARELGERLYGSLLRPIEARLSHRDRLFISAHLMLHALPWAALHDGQVWLAERFAFARVPPLVSEAREQCAAAPGRRWLLVLDPAHPTLESLPGLNALGEQLSARLHPVNTLAGDAATPFAVRAGLSGANALFYAGHASFDARRPMRSALLLAPSPLDHDDRIEALDLQKARRCVSTIVLLGCETARVEGGGHTFSDETIGLSRAFLAGGAEHVLGSLWPVVDRDAEDFARALVKQPLGEDIVRDVQRAQACLAAGDCPNRGVAAWGSYVVDSLLPGAATGTQTTASLAQ